MGKRVYAVGQPADCAYLLRQGEVEYWITDTDCVVLGGSNILIGASELLIAMNRREATRRHASLVLRDDALANPIPAAKLASFITSYTVGFSVAHHIAETITKLHAVLTEKMNTLHDTERLSRDLSTAYVEVMKFLDQESQRQHFPWLFSMLEKGKAAAAYNYGLSFTLKKDDKPIDVGTEKLAQYRQVYPKGATICREGEKADDMFILMEGKIEVRIKNNPIDLISHKGTIIGEMGLILGQPRTATLRAVDDTHVVKIGSGDMASIFRNDPDTFLDMISSLAFREHDNCEKIREYAQLVKKVAEGRGENSLAQVSEYALELSRFMAEIERAVADQPGMDWLTQIRDLAHRKVTTLLNQAGLATGETYETTSESRRPIDDGPREKPRPVRDSGANIPKIDWF